MPRPTRRKGALTQAFGRRVVRVFHTKKDVIAAAAFAGAERRELIIPPGTPLTLVEKARRYSGELRQGDLLKGVLRPLWRVSRKVR
jgi:hypothetical protein